MFCIMVSKDKLPQLKAKGAHVRINGNSVILKKVGDTLQWNDGKESRRILVAEVADEGTRFTCE